MAEPDLTPAVIFDIDGTLALIEHRRKHVTSRPKNWVAFYAGIPKDEPNIPVINTLHGLINGGYVGLLCSGRPDNYRDTTVAWLRQHFISYTALYMRKAGDYRADDIVKREILTEIRADGYNPILACDDRDRIVKMWRDEGLICLQAAEGDF